MSERRRHRVLALVSGGKDSCFAMMQCVAEGHTVVALANLRPPENVDELDSHMYQTVGHEGIGIYSEATGLPMFRGSITRKVKGLGAEYEKNDDDEVEDLYDLIAEAKASVEFDAVCSGAIMSNYQKNRVENICSRLGLVSLAYLWERDQSELLSEMISSRLRAIVIKCATLGLDQSHLGKTLGELQAHLHKMSDKYGINVCGEGGEFESFTLDSPLFYKEIELEVIVHSDDAFAPVAYLKMKGFKLKDKKLPTFKSQAEMLRHNLAGTESPLLPKLNKLVSEEQ